MSKKGIVSLLSIGVLAFGIGIGTYAWFTSQAVSNDNQFKAGTLKVTLNEKTGEDAAIFNFGQIDNLQPGATTNTVEATVGNNGTLNLAWLGYFDVTSATAGGTTKLSEALYIDSAKMEFRKVGSETPWLVADEFIKGGRGNGLYGAEYTRLADADPLKVVSLKTFMDANAMGVGNGVMTGALKPGYEYKFSFKLGMAPLAGNDYQGDATDINAVNVKYVVKATQVDAGALAALDYGNNVISIGSDTEMVTWYNAQITSQN